MFQNAPIKTSLVPHSASTTNGVMFSYKTMMFILYKYHNIPPIKLTMDIVYYSNYCKYSQKLIQYLAKNGLANKVNCINIDNRKRDPKTNQIFIHLEKGGTVLLPPNVRNVPSLLLVNEKFRVIIGEEIYAHFAPKVSAQNAVATNYNGEPESYTLPISQSGVSIQSEQFTFYNMSPDELSAKGKGGMRQMYNYVSAFHDNMNINTPPETYRPNKVSTETVEALEQLRLSETAPPAITNNQAVPSAQNVYPQIDQTVRNTFVSNTTASPMPPYATLRPVYQPQS